MATDLEQLVLTISADTRQMQRALNRLVGDTKSAASGVNNAFSNASPKIDKVANSIGKTNFQTANLAAQFQDIAVQLQGGQSPFTIALQQGTQISSVLGRGGAGGTVALLGSAFASLVSPISLATIGIIALGGYAIQYGAKAFGAISDLDTKLEEHSSLIKLLKESYGEAGKGVDVAAKEALPAVQALLGLKTDEIRKEFKALTTQINDTLSSTRGKSFGSLGILTLNTTDFSATRFKDFQQAIDNYRASVKAGTPDTLQLRNAIATVLESNPDEKTKKFATELYDLTDKAAKAQLAIESTAKSARVFSSEALAAAQQGEVFQKALKALGDTVTPDLDDRAKILKNYQTALDAAGGTEERLAAQRVKNAQLGVLAENERKKAAEEATKEAESAQKRFDSAINASSRHVAQIKGEADALGEGAGAMARLEAQYRLTEMAQQAFGKLSDETKKKIQEQAQAAGEAAEKLARARVNTADDFARKTAFLTPEDVAIASQLSQLYGNDVTKSLNSAEAAAMRMTNVLRTIGSITQDTLRAAFVEFGQQIRQGASAMDALKTAGLNALGKIVDKLAEMAFNNLWSSAFGSGGFSLASLFKGLPGFAMGTNSAPGGLAMVGERGPELVNLPRGAQVIPNNVLKTGFGNGVNSTVSISIDARGADERGFARLSGEMAKLKAELPSRVIQSVRDAQKRREL